MKYDNSETGCCAKINPKDWDKKTFNWKNKKFVKDHVTSILHIPINFGKVITRVMKEVDKKKAIHNDYLVLSDEKSIWGSDLYVSVNKKVDALENTSLSGTFLTKVFEGPYRNMHTWMKEMNKYVESKGKKVKKLWFYYTTCPKCAKHYGKNYVVIFAEV